MEFTINVGPPQDLNLLDLPPISEMIKIVKFYIWQRKGVMVNIGINYADEHNELLKLEKAFRISNEWLIQNQQQ